MILLRHILNLVCLCSCLGVSLFMSYLCDLFFIFIFFIINIISLKHTCFFVNFLEYVLLLLNDSMDEESKLFLNRKSSASGCVLDFAWFFANISLVLLTKVLLIKKSMSMNKVSRSSNEQTNVSGILQNHFWQIKVQLWLLI